STLDPFPPRPPTHSTFRLQRIAGGGLGLRFNKNVDHPVFEPANLGAVLGDFPLTEHDEVKIGRGSARQYMRILKDFVMNQSRARGSHIPLRLGGALARAAQEFQDGGFRHIEMQK
ncbi:MAG: hypothetical protein AB1813_19475, partial [Verrucomicrobiota bacterium]